ncbi:MAG: haloacid dehalogenase [Acetomicrobium flavidum]|uniref:HAD family hydrolase n=1 Tax=Acetomicrobium flavidum TaxID=49896 RepID=UPI0016B2713A|nr:haloacid dehalogenase [Acetomicrobium flavidum]
MYKSAQNYDALIFDMDGVLIDTTYSYPMVIRIAVQWSWRYLLGRDVDCTAFSYDHFYASKTHPAFNDDYDIAWALLSIAASKKTKSLKEAFPTIEHWKEILRSIQGDEVISWVYANFQQSIPREVVRQLCEEIYFGRDEYIAMNGKSPIYYSGRGLWRREKPMVGNHWRDLHLPVCIFTGRPWKECLLGLRLLGWEDMPRERIFTLDDGMPKPSPEGLIMLSTRVNAINPIIFGDTKSDLEAARRYGKGKFIHIGISKLPDELTANFEDVKSALRELGLVS